MVVCCRSQAQAQLEGARHPVLSVLGQGDEAPSPTGLHVLLDQGLRREDARLSRDRPWGLQGKQIILVGSNNPNDLPFDLKILKLPSLAYEAWLTLQCEGIYSDYDYIFLQMSFISETIQI